MDSLARTQQHAEADADYVQSTAEAIATLLNGQPAISRAEGRMTNSTLAEPV